ncbi:MAG: CTP synthase [Rickettsiales bacterium]|jgi:CTP synthase|nr:CTP synthase [Rickettsiales bacterium]
MEKQSALKQTKYIFITGGVVSSLGKGVAAASIGALLKSRGYSVHSRKFDPYLNVDPGTMSPFQHGEVYVTDDGFETDLDLGYYERFLGIKLSRDDSISGGRIFYDILTAERRGDYLGATVQMIPHVSNKIKEYIAAPAAGAPDFIISEIGGTVGDIEGEIFLESIRQFANDVGRRNAMFVHLTLAPFIESANELKTKPTQMSVRRLLESGIAADMLIVRTPRLLHDDERSKIAQFCNMPAGNVISGIDMDNIYKIPLEYERQNVASVVLGHFGLPDNGGELSNLQKISDHLSSERPKTNIAIVGKYFNVPDAYKSLFEALFHAGIANSIKVEIHKIDAESLENKIDDDIKKILGKMDGILVPGGFGKRGVPGKIVAAKFARENNVPYLGICLGMQVAAIEFMRNVCGIKDAYSTEFSKDCVPIVSLATEWEKDGETETRTENTEKGGTLRLGAYPTKILDKTLAQKIYKSDIISERHRHRYELNAKFADVLSKNGMQISGWSPDGRLPEIIEIPSHKFFIAGQFHPEFNSSPYYSHPLFSAFIAATKN